MFNLKKLLTVELRENRSNSIMKFQMKVAELNMM